MRLIAVAVALLVTPAFAGCFDGAFGLCIGSETPKKILQDSSCTKWVIEIDHVSGMGPSSSALELLEDRMETLVHKDSISIIVDQTDLGGRSSWSPDRLANLEAATRDHHTGGGTVVTRVLYVDGQLEGAPRVLGFAAGSRYVVIFEENIRDNTDGDLLISTTSTEMERAVLVHEFGHILGLVNNGIPMQVDREADECNGEPSRGHSTNQNSVMYCAVESTAFFDLFGSTQPPTAFDANDRRDVACAGGKGTC